MGLTMMTAAEIFTNPHDLEIVIGQERGGGRYAVRISRGPGHKFKPLLSSTPFAETLDVAIEAVKQILETTNENLTKEFENSESLLSLYTNPNGVEVDQSKVLNSDLILRILGELRQHRVASTYKMLPGSVRSK